MVLESYVQKILEGLVGKYLEGLDKKNLKIEELQQLGDFYETYEHPILTAIDCDTTTFEENINN